MGRYSSDSESSRSSRHKKSKRSSRRSSRARSRSHSPKRCRKKQKKYKRSSRSHSREGKNRYGGESKSKYRTRSRSRSHSASERRRKRSNSRDGSYRRKDDQKKTKYSKSKRRHRSSSSSSSSSSSTSSSSTKSKSVTPKRRFEYDPDELLEKLNKAAVEAMAANKKSKPDPLSTIEMQIKRQDFINELRGNTSSILDSKIEPFQMASSATPPAPLLSTKTIDSANVEDSPVFVDINSSTFNINDSSQPSNTESLLHPNFLLENQDEKLNRWVKKLFQIRQRAMSGEQFSV